MTGASVTPTALVGPEGLEPHSRLHASHDIASAWFSPGPWEVVASEHPDNGNRWLEIVDSGYGSIIGEVFNDEAEYEPGITHEIANANARLIAAAPELYESNEYAATVLREAAAILRGSNVNLRGCAEICDSAALRSENANRKARGEQVQP